MTGTWVLGGGSVAVRRGVHSVAEGSSGSREVMASIIRAKEGRDRRANGLDGGKARSHVLVRFGDRVADRFTLRVAALGGRA